MLRFMTYGIGAGAPAEIEVVHGLGETPDWAHCQTLSQTPGLYATLSNLATATVPWTAATVFIRVHGANVNYRVDAVVWQGRSY